MADTSLVENKIGLLIWKNSNLWQSNLRKILKTFKITLNEYLILYSLYYLLTKKKKIYQYEIADYIGIDVSVVSVTLKLLDIKNCISRKNDSDYRKKNIELLNKGKNLIELLYPIIEKEEERLFNKLNNETFNFTNSLKLLLGKKIRIKAKTKN